MFSQLAWRPTRWWLPALLLVVAPFPGIYQFWYDGFTFFYQTLTPESVLWACGHGLHHPHEVIEPLFAFLSGESRAFECGDLGALPNLGEVGLFARLQPYFTWAAAWCWGLFGLHYHALLPLVWVFYGAYAAGAYQLARLFLGRRMAAVAAVGIALAPLAVDLSTHLRDFSKGPFFLWTLVFLIRAVRSRKLLAGLLWSGAAAVVTGVGYGFRPDLLILIPLGALFLAIGARPGEGAPRPLLQAAPFLFPLTLVVTYGLVSMPIWRQIDIGGVGGTFAMQGATAPFRLLTGLKPAGYTTGWVYSDELTLSGTAAALRQGDPDWDAREQARRPVLDISAALTGSSAYLMGWADLFAADFIGQAGKSAVWVAGLPALAGRAVPSLTQEACGEECRRPFPARVSVWLYHWVAHAWLTVLALVALVALLFQRYAQSPREALALFVLFGVLAAYPSIQFSARHVFHLEFLWIVAVLSLPGLLRMPWTAWRAFPAFAGRAVGVLAGLVGIYLVAVIYQHLALHHAVHVLLDGPAEPVSSAPITLANGERFFAVPVPPAQQPLLVGPTDSLVLASRFRGIRWDVRAGLDRLFVEVGGARCNLDGLTLDVHYAHQPDTWQPFDNRFRLLRTPQRGTVGFLIPAFYRSTQHFDGILLPASARDCTVSITRLLGSTRLPTVFTATLDGRRILGPSHYGFGGFAPQAGGSAVTAVLYRPDS